LPTFAATLPAPELPFPAFASLEQFSRRPDDLLNLVSQVSAFEIIAIGFEANPYFHDSSQAVGNSLNLLFGWPLDGALLGPYREEIIIEIDVPSLARRAPRRRSRFFRFLGIYYHAIRRDQWLKGRFCITR